MSYHVDVIPNRNSPPAILFRQAQRDDKRIRRTTLANLSKLPPQIVDGVCRQLGLERLLQRTSSRGALRGRRLSRGRRCVRRQHGGSEHGRGASEEGPAALRLESIALVGDRGMLTTARLRDDLEPAGLAWISALKTDAIRKLLRKPQPDAEGAGRAPNGANLRFLVPT